MKKIVIAVSLLLTLMSRADAADTINIGLFGPVTGAAATGGISFLKGWQYAVKTINDDGGILIDGTKKKIALVVEDTQSRPDVGMTVALKLITRDQVDILVGDMLHADVTLAVMELASAYPKILFTGLGISLDISAKIKADKKKFANVWKFNFGSDSYAATVQQTLLQLVAEGQLQPTTKSIAIVGEDTGFSKPIFEALIPLLQQAGWKVAVQEVLPMGTSDYFPQVTKIRQTKPDYIVSIFTALNSGVALTRQLRERGVRTPHIGINFPTLHNFIPAAGVASEGLLFTPLLFDPLHNSAHRQFADRIRGFLGSDPDSNNVSGYCSASLLADAIKRAGSLDLARLNAAIADTDFQCLTGRWAFDLDSHSPRIGPGYIEVPSGQIQGGKLFSIWPKSLATTEYKPK